MNAYTLLFSVLLVSACGSDLKETTIVEEVSVDGATDADGDGSTSAVDCDDSDPFVHPGADEVCNEVDDDCNGLVDDGVIDGTSFYRDVDGDGYGDSLISESACSAPDGFVTDATDCDDRRADVNPGASEDDCTDPVDYNCDGSVGYADVDGDGTPACEDCDDTNPTVNPYAAEICNDGVDDDCDGEGDEAGAVGEQIWFADADGDLHGDPSSTVTACDAPEGYVETATDCDDDSAAANPSGAEVCDGLDNDCDGIVDGPEPIGGTLMYADGDGDGFGSSAVSLTVCTPIEGFVLETGDCDDGDALAYPGGSEVCDSIDNDCDGEIDEDLLSTFFADPDGDGYGLEAVTMDACATPDGYAAMAGDCDESEPTAFPGGTEVCDGIDNDCNGEADEGLGLTYYLDIDSDGYGDADAVTIACSFPEGHTMIAGDCAPLDAAISPAADEVCDGIDNDCDSAIDDADSSVDFSGITPWYADLDGDGYGDPSSPLSACDPGDDYVTDDSDCDDSDVDAYPGAAEVWYDGVDQDCDGGSDYDADGDGYDTVESGGDDEDDSDPDCWADCLPDYTESDPGYNCKTIAEDDPDLPNGWYWIAPDGSPMEVYCDIENGGWMMCFELENTGSEDLGTENTWLNDCIEYSMVSWTDNELRVKLESELGFVIYDETGTREHSWTYDQITSTTSPSNQFYSYDHERLVSLSNGDKLMMAGQNSSNNGCGGSLGNGYSVVIYPSEPDYYSNIKMLVMPYKHPIGGLYPRSFSGWSEGHEISYNAGTMNTCSFTTSQLGTFTFWVR